MPIPGDLGRPPQRQNLGVGGGILAQFPLISGRRNHSAVGVEHERSDGNIARLKGETRIRDRLEHPLTKSRRRCLHLRSPRSTRFKPMRVHVADHPLITHKLTVLRDKNTASPTFRALTEELVTLLAYEATRSVRTEPVKIETPVTETMGVAISHPLPLVVPILRAGLGMLDGMVKLVPTAEVGFLGLVRDEETLQPTTYAERLPDDLSNRQCFVLDPMLATGGSLVAAINYLFDRGAQDVTAICLLGTPEGLKAVDEATQGREVTIVLGALDERLNERGYIVPGLGDAGDRLYGTV